MNPWASPLVSGLAEAAVWIADKLTFDLRVFVAGAIAVVAGAMGSNEGLEWKAVAMAAGGLFVGLLSSWGKRVLDKLSKIDDITERLARLEGVISQYMERTKDGGEGRR